MAKCNLLDATKRSGIIVIVRGVEGENLINLFSALYDGGIEIAEITFGKYSDEKTFELLKEVTFKFGDKMVIGAGTVTTLKRAELAKKAGVSFIVSPVTDSEVISYAKDNGLYIISGAFTPTEIKNAYDLGADLVKIFPASAVGPSYIKAVLSPLSNIPLVPFGGININNIEEYINAGAVGAGVGQDIVNSQFIESGNFEKITEIAEKFVKTVKKCLK